MFEKGRFKPLNEAEKGLVAAQRGKVDLEQFILETLIPAEIAILTDRPMSGTPGEPFNTLHLDSLENFDAIAIFTHRDRALAFLPQYPIFQHVNHVSCGWLLQLVPSDMGLMLNPGTEVELLIYPDDVQDLKLRSAGQPPPLAKPAGSERSGKLRDLERQFEQMLQNESANPAMYIEVAGRVNSIFVNIQGGILHLGISQETAKAGHAERFREIAGTKELEVLDRPLSGAELEVAVGELPAVAADAARDFLCGLFAADGRTVFEFVPAA